MHRARSLSLVFVFLAGLVAVALAASATAEDAWQAGDMEAAERYRDLERERARRFREEVAERARTTPARQEPARKRTPAPARHTVVAVEEPAPEAGRQDAGEGLLGWPRRIGEDFLAFAGGLRDRFVTAIVERFEEGADGIVTSIAAWLEDEMFPAIAGVLRDELLPSQEPALEPERLPAREAEREPVREAREKRLAGPEARAPRRNRAMRLIKPSTRSQQVRSEQLAAEWQQLGDRTSGDVLHATRWWQEEAERRFRRALGRDAR
jgi:hypothetical protein